MSYQVTLAGYLIDWDRDYVGPDGLAYGKPYLNDPANAPTILFAFQKMIATLSASAVINGGGLAPQAAGNIVIDDGVNWRRSLDVATVGLLAALALGTSPAQSGKVRIPNGTANGVVARNAAGSGDVRILDLDGSNILQIGATASSVNVPVDMTLGARLVFSTASSKIVPGGTSLSLRNNADTADNVLISNAGAVTVRSDLNISAILRGASDVQIVAQGGSGDVIVITNATERCRFFRSGMLTYGHSTSSGSGAGDIVLINTAMFRALNLAGTSGKALIGLNASNNVLIDSDALGTVFGAGITHASTTLLTTSVALSNGAAAAAGTLTNAPFAGNPTKWAPVNDNGTIRYMPLW